MKPKECIRKGAETLDNGASSYRRFLDGDKEGIVEIICEYREGLTFYLYRFTGNISTAEEIAEDTFVKLCTKKPNFSGKSSFKTWLYAIGRNCALNYIKRLRFRSDKPIHEYTDISDNTDIEAEYIAKEEGIMVKSAMEKLNSDYRQVLSLLFMDECTTEEAAKIMGKTKRQIGNLVYRAKNALRSELRKEGFCNDEQ